LTGFATLATAQVTSSNLMNKGSNIPVLNAQNLSDGVYTLPLPDANTTQIRMKLKGYVFGMNMRPIRMQSPPAWRLC